MRILTLASVIAVATVTVNATPGVALFDGSGAVDRPGDQRLLGIHYLTLKDGVKPEDFERFIIGEWNPIMSQLYPGIHLMVVKGERNAREGEYLLVYDIQSMNVRDGYWHSSGVQTAASETIWEECGQACSDPGDKFDSMAEVTNWADYVEIARD